MAERSSPEGSPGAPEGRRRPSPRIAQMKRTFYFLRRSTLAMVGLGIVLFWIGVAVYSPFYHAPSDQLARYCNSNIVNPANGSCIGVCGYPSGAPPAPGCYQYPTSEPSVFAPTAGASGLGPLPLGSLTVSADGPYFFSILDGVIKGAPWSLGIGGAIVGSGAVIGLFLGALAGFKGGYTDETIMRATDIFLAIPGLFLVLIVLTVSGNFAVSYLWKIAILIIAFVVTWWPLYTRIVRGQVLVTREQKYVEAARASGAKSGRILVKHIIPNSLYPVFVQLSLDVGTVPLLLGAIIFLGYQIWPNPYFPEWGTISAYSVTGLSAFLTLCQLGPCTFPTWQILIPGLTLFLFAIAVNFLSDGLRDALDPRLRR